MKNDREIAERKFVDPLLPDSEVSLKSRGFQSPFQGKFNEQRAEGFLEVSKFSFSFIIYLLC